MPVQHHAEDQLYLLAGLLDTFAAACVRVSAASRSESQQQALAAASSAFAAAGLTTAQLETLVRLPWQQMQVTQKRLMCA